MVTKISSYDGGYLPGDLSVFPAAIDSYETLYFAKNNSETFLLQSCVYGSNSIIVNSTESFPEKGILRITLEDKFAAVPEFVYYDAKTDNTFTNLIRGYAGTRQQNWPINCPVIGGVFSEHHNALKDAIINIETYLGASDNIDTTAVNSRLSALERKFYNPQPIFRANPRSGRTPLTVKFQNFTTEIANKFFWDFGDGGTSLEKSPEHTYLTEGVYSVSCRAITNIGGQGFAKKNNYIKVSNDIIKFLFYVSPVTGYSIKTASKLSIQATNFKFTDQTDGNIQSRFWIFDDGSNENQSNPLINYANHFYVNPGTYTPSLLITTNLGSNKISASSTIKVL